jgi:transmembrane sensor
VFAVRAGAVTVSVLGTSFSVERVADRVGVTVTRGAVQVDWGAGARQLAAGEDGWFPPLVVSPAAADEPTPGPAKEARPPRHKRTTADDSPATPAAPAPTDAPAPAAPKHVEPPAPAVPPAPVVPPAPDAAKLLADADRARLAGRFDEGASLLQRLIREHPGDQRAPLAAFSLGRILLGELHRPAEAAQAFARVRTLAPDGPLAEDALAREVEAWARAGDLDRARVRGAEYMRKYPNGTRAADVTEAVRSNR